MTKKDFVDRVVALTSWQNPVVVKRAALLALDILASDLRMTMWEHEHANKLIHRDLDSSVSLNELRCELSHSIVFKAALAELAYKKPGQKKLPLSKLKKKSDQI